jgi:hypothetical protein
MLMATVTEVGPRLGIAPTCAALGGAAGDLLPTAATSQCPAAAPAVAPRAQCRGAGRRPLMLHEPRFVDLAPAEVYARRLRIRRAGMLFL